MTEPLSSQVRMHIAYCLVRGMSYPATAQMVGASKSSAFNVWRDLVEGRTPIYEDISDLAPLLREVAVEIRERSLSIEEVSLWLQALQHWGELGLAPAGLERFIAVVERLAKNEGEASLVIKAAMNLHRLEESTGLKYNELEAKAIELEGRCRGFEQQIAKGQGVIKELENTTRERDDRRKEVQDLETKKNSLRQDIDVRQRHLEKLSEQTQALEARTHTAETRMASARQAEERAAAMGLTAEQLPKLIKRLEPLMLQHEGPIEAVIDRLVADLEEAGSGAALKAKRVAGQRTMKKLQEDIQNRRIQIASLEAETAQLEATREQAKSQLRVMQEQAVPLLNDAASRAVASVEQAGKTLVGAQTGLVTKTLELGRTVAAYVDTLNTLAWLGGLQDLIEGKGTPKNATVKMALEVVLKAFSRWLIANHPKGLPSSSLSDTNTLLATLNQWKVDDGHA